MGRINGWEVTEELREKFTPIIKEYIDKLEQTNLEDEPEQLELTFQGIGPYQLSKILEELGYEEDEDCPMDTNGWELDFWMYYNHPDKKNYAEKLVISGTGITFELKLGSGVN